MLRSVAIGVMAALSAVSAQSQTAKNQPVAAQAEPCSASAFSHPREEQTANRVSVANIAFWGSDIQMPPSEQTDVAEAVEQMTHGDSVEAVVEEATERVREGWQNRGYFQVHVTADAEILSSSTVSRRLSLSVHVEEGSRYTLREITFTHNKTLTNVNALRALFPIKDGEIFNREKIGTGLENLKFAYRAQGFVNFASFPKPSIDDSTRSIALEVDVDEGKQFSVRNIAVLGVSEAERQGILAAFLLKPGQLYNENLFRLSMERQGPRFPGCPCEVGHQLGLDEKNATVEITLDLRPCS